MADLRHASPLDGVGTTIEAADLRIAEAPVRRQMLVQTADGAWPGLDLPPTPNRRTTGDPYAVWWSPESRLLVFETGTIDLGGVIAHDLTDGLAVLDLDGPAVTDLLAIGCGLDLEALAPDGSARTLLAQVPILLTRRGDGFRIHVDRALLPHVWAWASEAATALPGA